MLKTQGRTKEEEVTRRD